MKKSKTLQGLDGREVGASRTPWAALFAGRCGRRRSTPARVLLLSSRTEENVFSRLRQIFKRNRRGVYFKLLFCPLVDKVRFELAVGKQDYAATILALCSLTTGDFFRRERGRLREQDERHDASVLECIGNPLEILYILLGYLAFGFALANGKRDAAIAVALTTITKSVSQGATSAVNAAIFIAVQ